MAFSIGFAAGRFTMHSSQNRVDPVVIIAVKGDVRETLKLVRMGLTNVLFVIS